ncbi:MAG: hypothetical protein WCP97_06185, partial [bacterium]
TNVSMYLYFLRHERALPPAYEGAGTVIGLISGIFGVGCSSCGTLFVESFLVATGTSGLLNFLPMHGEEFSLLSVILLVLSISWVGRSIVEGKNCALNRNNVAL